jgi:hypothetical protein
MKSPKNLLTLALLAAVFSTAQAQTSAAVPRLVSFSGKAVNAQGRAISGPAGVTFAIYGEQSGGSPLWMETQSIVIGADGDYIAQLGATRSSGLPLDLFASAEARWLGVRINGGEEQPRVMLLSVPYALKAGDAATIGGLPPSAFMLAAPLAPGTPAAEGTTSNSASVPPASSNVTTTGGTANTLPLFTTATNVQNSAITQLGTGAKAQIGINTTTPTTTLDVHGGAAVRGTLVIPATGLATAAAGKPSEPINMTVSTFNSGSSTVVGQTFQIKTEPANNNTVSPGATFNLLFGHGANPPVETGFKIASNGIVTFSAGQNFPGTGTVIAVKAGTGMTGGGSSGAVTLSLDPTRVPLLASANTFTGNQTVNGNLTSTGIVSGSSYQIGSNLFVFGSYANANAFLGFAGNSSTTGIENTASGLQALTSNTAGSVNVASGWKALSANTTGNENTAIGGQALSYNTTGGANTATGYGALESNFTGTGNTANGWGALATNTASDNTATGAESLFANGIGTFNTADGSGALHSNTSASYNTAVGAQALYSNVFSSDYNLSAFNNTAVGAQALYSNTVGYDNTALGYVALYSNVGGSGSEYFFGSGNTAVGVSALRTNTTGYDNTAVGGGALQNNTTGYDLTCVGLACEVTTDGLSNATAIGAHAVVGQSNSLVLGGTGAYAVKVGIGTTEPSAILTIARGAGHPVSDSWETYSSRRWKTNIHTLPNALAKVERLRGVTYDQKDSGKHEIGVIAEEVGAVVPEIVTYEPNGQDARGVDYARLTALLIEATKQQQREIQQQRNALRAQSAAIRELKTQLRVTRQSLQKVQSQVEAGKSRFTLAAK